MIDWPGALAGHHVVAVVAEYTYDTGAISRLLTWIEPDSTDLPVDYATLATEDNRPRSFNRVVATDVDGRDGTELVLLPASDEEKLLVLTLAKREGPMPASVEPLAGCSTFADCQLRPLRVAAEALSGVRDEAELRGATPISGWSAEVIAKASTEALLSSLVYAPPARLRKLVDPRGVEVCAPLTFYCMGPSEPIKLYAQEARAAKCQRIDGGAASERAVDKLLTPRLTGGYRCVLQDIERCLQLGFPSMIQIELKGRGAKRRIVRLRPFEVTPLCQF